MPRDIHVRLARLVARRSGAPESDDFVSAYAGAHGSATSQWNGIRTPTKAQAKAGNYALGTVNWHGLTLKIENPAHTVREGEGEDGKSWRSVMMAHYGYIAGTRGADGDEVDVFLGPYPESDSAWILNQRNATGGFDEHKVLAGFHTAAAAEDAYRLSYERGWDRYAAPIPVTLDQLRWWLRNADTSREFTSDLVPETAMSDTAVLPTPELPRVLWDSAANPLSGHTLASVLYAIRANDGRDGLVLDPMSMADITEGAEVVALDALVTEAGKLKPKMAALMRIMEAAGGDIKPVALQMSDLLRRYGGVHVAALFELSDGQTITIWFHNPDATPSKFTPADMLVSWKWQLNKKDITIVVAPESGHDLDLREVARRLMRLAQKNSAAFAKANAKRADTMAEIQTLKDTLAERQGTLKGLMAQIEVEKVAVEDRQAKQVALPFSFASASDHAMRLFRLAFTSGAKNNAYASAVAVESALPAGVSIQWDTEASAPTDVVAMDDVAGLFGSDQGGGYVAGEVRTSEGKLVATVHIRGDGAVMVDLSDEGADLYKIDYRDPERAKTGFDDIPDGIGSWVSQSDSAGFESAMTVLHDIAYDMRPWSEKDADEEAKAKEFARVQQEQEDADAEARSEAIKAAQEFGATKPGFKGAFWYREPGLNLGNALNRKPAGTFVFVIDKINGGRYGVTMFSRQPTSKKGGIDKAGKVGNIQPVGLLPTAEEAYEAGTNVIRLNGGVVLGEPQIEGATPISRETIEILAAGVGADVEVNKETAGGAVEMARLELRGMASFLDWRSAAGMYQLTSSTPEFNQFGGDPGPLIRDWSAKVEKVAPPVSMQRWLVTNTSGYSAIHEAETMVRAIQEGMGAVDYTLPSSAWSAVPAQGGSQLPKPEPQPAPEPAPEPTPELTPPTESAETKFLREITSGTHDALSLADMLDKIEAAVKKLDADGLLVGDTDAAASAAITHWAELESAQNDGATVVAAPAETKSLASMTRDEILAALVNADVAQWGEGERDASAQMHSGKSIGLLANTFARHPFGGKEDPAVVDEAKKLLTKDDMKQLRKGG